MIMASDVGRVSKNGKESPNTVQEVKSLEELAFQMSFKSVCGDLSLCPDFLNAETKSLNPYSSFLSMFGFHNSTAIKQLVNHRLNQLVGTLGDSVRARFLSKFFYDSFGTLMPKETIRTSPFLWVVLERSMTTLDIRLPFPAGELDPETLTTIAEKCPDLTELALNFGSCFYSSSFKPEHFKTFLMPLQQLPKLTTLTLYDIGDEFLPSLNLLGSLCSQLKVLRLYRCAFKPEAICQLLLKDPKANPLHDRFALDDVVAQLYFSKQYLHPFCQTLEELAFVSPEQKEFRCYDYQDTMNESFASPGFFSFALRHCPNLKILRSKCLLGDAIKKLFQWKPLTHPTLAPTILWLPATHNLGSDIQYTKEGPNVGLVSIMSKCVPEEDTTSWGTADSDDSDEGEDAMVDDLEPSKKSLEKEKEGKEERVPLAKFQTFEGLPDICRMRFSGQLQLTCLDFSAKNIETVEAVTALCSPGGVTSMDILDGEGTIFEMLELEPTVRVKFFENFTRLKRLSLGGIDLEKNPHVLSVLPASLEVLLLNYTVTVALYQLVALNATNVKDLRLGCLVKFEKQEGKATQTKDVCLSGITHLTISVCHTSKEELEDKLYKQPELTHLNLECLHCFQEPQDWLKFAKKHWKRLESLHVRSCEGLNAETTKALFEICPKLKHVLLPSSLRALKKERYDFKALQLNLADRGGSLRFGKLDPWAKCYRQKISEPWEGSVGDEDYLLNRENVAFRISQNLLLEDEDSSNGDHFGSYGSDECDYLRDYYDDEDDLTDDNVEYEYEDNIDDNWY